MTANDLNTLAKLIGAPPIDCEERVLSKLRECATKLNYTHDLPVVVYDLKGTTAGQAILNRNKIRLNTHLLHTNTEEMIEQTVPHEFAHIVAYRLYDDNGHGKYWQHVMLKLGLTPHRCHNMATEKARQTKQFEYYCDCRPSVMLGLTRHKRILNNGARYYCCDCRATLRRKENPT